MQFALSLICRDKEIDMPTLQVREVPAAVYGALSEAASAQHRSLAQQALVTLERGLELSGDRKLRRERLIETIAGRESADHSQFADPVDLIREDRGR
jgi:hypothetical protein